MLNLNKIFLVIFLSLITTALRSQVDYKYSISQRIIATDFINSTNRVKKITSLPRGIELNLTKYITAKSFLQIPLRAGFSRASNLDTLTTGKVFYGFDCQYGYFIKGYRILPYLTAGVGLQSLNKKWHMSLPIGLGLEVPLDSSFYLSLHTSYRHSSERAYTALQYGLGISFKIGHRNNNNSIKPNEIPLIPETSEENDSLIAYRSGISELNYLPYIDFKLLKMRKGSLDSVRLKHLPILEISKTSVHDEALGYNQSIKFKTNSSAITQASIAALKAIADKMLENPTVLITIEGHTDNVGSESYNMHLSLLRAKTCHDYLVNFGVNSERITVKGWGEQQPKADNATEAGRAINRRVEIY